MPSGFFLGFRAKELTSSYYKKDTDLITYQLYIDPMMVKKRIPSQEPRLKEHTTAADRLR